MLKIYNTITKSLEEFKPINKDEVKIYICGPTVYDHSHIGHARTYVTFDAIRNILEKYFNYNVVFVMNITDIDDKIINKSREQNKSISEITEKYTELFLTDMDKLNVRRPSYLTKVTEYIENIKEYIDVLIEKGYAYESNGSVYFDIEKYKENYKYPIFIEKSESLENGNEEKRNMQDFALWKKSKENEIGFDYRGNKGRPGWHIECSVMSSDILGNKVDIHAGGIDLKFPHHENEIAQCQSYFSEDKWVNYFMHTGHLNINGLKMSKSLKNFTTIKTILEKATSMQLRILFLYHQWNKDMNYEEEQLKFAESVEKKINNFLMYVETIKNSETKSGSIIDESKSVQCNDTNTQSSIENNLSRLNLSKDKFKSDREVYNKLKEVNSIVDASFRNNFDTPNVLKAIVDLITFTNIRLATCKKDTLQQVKDYVVRILDILGIKRDQKVVDSDSEQLAEILSEFRNSVRSVAKQCTNKKGLYEICDQVRDKLKEIGYAIEDSNLVSIIKKL